MQLSTDDTATLAGAAVLSVRPRPLGVAGPRPSKSGRSVPCADCSGTTFDAILLLFGLSWLRCLLDFRTETRSDVNPVTDPSPRKALDSSSG
jgi:hypothetical protein